MSETSHHSSAQPAVQHGEDLLQEPRQEEAQVRPHLGAPETRTGLQNT